MPLSAAVIQSQLDVADECNMAAMSTSVRKLRVSVLVIILATAECSASPLSSSVEDRRMNGVLDLADRPGQLQPHVIRIHVLYWLLAIIIIK